MWSNRLSAVRNRGESRRLVNTVTRSQRRKWKSESDWRRQRDADREALRWRSNHTGEMEGRARQENTVRQTERARCKHIHHMLHIISLCCYHNWMTDWPTGRLTGWLAALLPGRWDGWLTYWLIGWLTPIISWGADKLAVWLADLLIYTLTDWLAGWLVYSVIVQTMQPCSDSLVWKKRNPFTQMNETTVLAQHVKKVEPSSAFTAKQ